MKLINNKKQNKVTQITKRHSDSDSISNTSKGPFALGDSDKDF